MLVVGFPAAAFATNCFVLATGPGEDALVVDPGVGVEEPLREVLKEHRLRPAAVLLTHGHLDHVYAVTPVCGASGIAAYIHDDDAYRLHDPLAQIDAGMLWMMEQEFGGKATWKEPDDVRRVADGEVLELAGLALTVEHAPGHTEGSVVFTVPERPDGVNVEVNSTLVAGDVLFAGSIGRCDLPGGDEAAMNRSLRDVILPMPDDRLVLPGHGPLTTIGLERQRNPFLRQLR
ncbi:MAG: MBL fold metallo-hydrolase [Actinomycetales bacterium]|nr:MAG: MBL fold metallo-hydrolase [Actinomycetales bacterium]